MKGIYRIADKNIEISSLYDTVQDMCGDYRTEGEPDLTVTITEEDIALEREQAPSFSDDYLETLAVYRKIAEAMPDLDTVLIHGSAIAVDGQAYLFTASSGTGKSMHASLWCQLLGEQAVMINDDKPLVRISSEEAMVYGTPWNGKHHLGENIAVPLQAVCFLERGMENTISRIRSAEGYMRLLSQVYRPRDSAATQKTLSLLDGMCHLTTFYRLSCNMDISAAELSFRTMSGKTRRLKLSEHFIVRKMDEKTVLMPGGGTDFSGVMIGNAVLGDILSLMKEDTTEEDIVTAIEDIYDAPEGSISRDVAKTLSELRDIGALVE